MMDEAETTEQVSPEMERTAEQGAKVKDGRGQLTTS